MDEMDQCWKCTYYFYALTLSTHRDRCGGKEEQDKLLASWWKKYPENQYGKKN